MLIMKFYIKNFKAVIK